MYEIPQNLLDWGAGHSAPAVEPVKRSRGRFRKGMVVRHPLFGPGNVVTVESRGDDQKLTVQFRSAGRKKLMARFADLEVLK